MELLLSRHARKLLMSHSLRDLGRFSAHLDFPLSPWLMREGHRAAKVEDFPFSLQQLHREFQWPLPPPCYRGNNKDSPTSSSSLFSPASTIRDHTPSIRDHTPKCMATPSGCGETDVGDDETADLATASDLASESPEGSAIRRAHRPPNLNLSPSRELEQHNVTLEPTRTNDADFDPTRSSTPTKNSGSVSEKVSLVMRNNPCEYMCMHVHGDMHV